MLECHVVPSGIWDHDQQGGPWPGPADKGLHAQMLELALARSLDGAHRVVQGSRPGSASAASFGRPAKQARRPDRRPHSALTPLCRPSPIISFLKHTSGRRWLFLGRPLMERLCARIMHLTRETHFGELKPWAAP